MELLRNQDRIVQLQAMLFEMARGNFKKRIALSGLDDELETLIVLINMVAEEMDESIFQDGYLSVHQSRCSFVQSTLLVDAASLITDVNLDSEIFLGYKANDLLNRPLAEFMTADSWIAFEDLLQTSSEKRTALSIGLLDIEHVLIAATCTVLRLAGDAGIVLTITTPFYNASNSEDVIEKSVDMIKQRPAPNVFVTQQLYDYILANLGEPLPPIFILSRKFGTNDYKLKEDFRHFFKMSIYKFYNEERLKRAYFLIQTSTLTFKVIAEMNGYLNYPNFCKAFKKHYGFSPSTMKRL
ncbi:helix-turn-helix domain-containing protein [Flavobacterium tegetincola]|uniref:helix-turn-helix domain-containing protein n=1 Tax=Flavobacterium tegetincola TaxID=150172 RepID=UPI00041ED713|nr:AraC family transcriptional regulator [Flavobacterium tegetincola]